jgi:hypothetical protein
LPARVLDARPSLWWRYAALLLVGGQTTGVEEKLHAAEAALVPALYAALRPGGVLWIKDKGPDMAQAGTHPAYQQLVRWCFSALEALGGHIQIIAELRPLLARAGFREERLEVEAYPLGGPSAVGRAMLSNMLHLFAATQPAVTRVHQVPASEIQALSGAVAQAARQSRAALGICPFSNLLVRRPDAG